MMSWLDKFFSVFLGEEKKEEKAVRPEEGPVAPKQPVFEQHKEYKKIEDTKVYYEYPTGNFRFPLVPDEPQRDGVKQERRRPKQGQPKAKQKTYESKQTVQPAIQTRANSITDLWISSGYASETNRVERRIIFCSNESSRNSAARHPVIRRGRA
jgi:hypothetical protein